MKLQKMLALKNSTIFHENHEQNFFRHLLLQINVNVCKNVSIIYRFWFVFFLCLTFHIVYIKFPMQFPTTNKICSFQKLLYRNSIRGFIPSFAILFANELEFAKCFLSYSPRNGWYFEFTDTQTYMLEALERNPKMSIESCKIVKRKRRRRKSAVKMYIFFMLVYNLELAQP